MSPTSAKYAISRHLGVTHLEIEGRTLCGYSISYKTMTQATTEVTCGNCLRYMKIREGKTQWAK